MARVNPVRLAVLLAIPIALVSLAQRFEAYGRWYQRHDLRGDVGSAVRRLRWNLRTAAVLDSLSSGRIASQSLERRGVRIRHSGRLSAPVLDSLASRIASETALLPPRPAGEVWAEVVLADTRRIFSATGTDVLVPGGAWQPCRIVVAPNRDAGNQNLLPAMLGQCALAAFGPPGPAVRSWLDGLSPRYGRPALHSFRNLSPDTSGRWLLDAQSEVRNQWGGWSDQDLAMFGCRRGDRHACRVVLGYRYGFGGLRGEFVWWLFRTRGSDAFTRFWRAGGDVDAAARSGFGETLDQAMGRFLAERLVVTGAGPRPSRGSVLSVLEVLTLSLVAAVAIARRRVAA